MKSVFIFISLLIMLCPAFSQSRMEHYLDSLGLVNVGRMDPTLKIDLMYTRADNFTGKVLYEDLQEAYLHPEAAKALLQAQKRLKELYPGYSLIIYDAGSPRCLQYVRNGCLPPMKRTLFAVSAITPCTRYSQRQCVPHELFSTRSMPMTDPA